MTASARRRGPGAGAGWLLGLAVLCSAPARACDVEYRIRPHFIGSPRGFEVQLSFDADQRRQTWLRLNDGFAGLGDHSAALSGWRADGDAQVTPAEPGSWQVDHPAGARLTVRYRVRAALDDPDGWQAQASDQQFRPQVGANWLQFFGHAALVDVVTGTAPVPGRHACLYVDPLPAQAVVASSHGVGTGPQTTFTVAGPPAVLMNAFYAAGTGWRLLERRLRSGRLQVLVRNTWSMSDVRFADRVAQVVDAQRAFWGDEAEADQLFVLTSNRADGVRSAGVRVHRTAVLHAARDFHLDSDSFHELVGHENLHEWIPRRLGGANPLQTWFSEGFTDYYTHRLLLRSGVWSLERYAQVLTRALRRYRQSPVQALGNAEAARRRFSDREIGQLPYWRGEFLALRWDMLLRQRGHAGLDPVMRGLLLPADAPPPRGDAVDRLLAALRPLLGRLPQDDLAAHVDQGRPFEVGADWLGPCFAFETAWTAPWSLGFSPRSFETSQLVGVDPDGPAAAAGLRDGQLLAGWSLDGDDEVRLWVRRGSGETVAVSYRPAGAGRIEQPLFRVKSGAADDPACRRWVQR